MRKLGTPSDEARRALVPCQHKGYRWQPRWRCFFARRALAHGFGPCRLPSLRTNSPTNPGLTRAASRPTPHEPTARPKEGAQLANAPNACANGGCRKGPLRKTMHGTACKYSSWSLPKSSIKRVETASLGVSALVGTPGKKKQTNSSTRTGMLAGAARLRDERGANAAALASAGSGSPRPQ